MRTTIQSFHQDDAADWVAALSCGHTQHMRHRPPWENRAWITDEAGRAARVGAEIDCPLCDMPQLPEGAVEYKRTATFTEQSVPAALLSEHHTRERT
jgi:tellurite methyltransferase